MLRKGACPYPGPPSLSTNQERSPAGKSATFPPPGCTSARARNPGAQERHGEASDRPGEAQADQHQGHRGGGERGGAEEGLQPSPALHPGEGQEHRHAPGLLLRPGSHREGPPGGQVDPNAAVLL